MAGLLSHFRPKGRPEWRIEGPACRDGRPSATAIEEFSGNFHDPAQHDFFGRWLDLWRGDKPPLFTEFRLPLMPELMPRMIVFDHHGPERKLRFRYVGFELTERMKNDPTGQYLSDIDDAEMMAFWDEGEHLMQRSWSPLLIEFSMRFLGLPFVSIEELLVPLLGEDGDMVRCVAFVLVK